MTTEAATFSRAVPSSINARQQASVHDQLTVSLLPSTDPFPYRDGHVNHSESYWRPRLRAILPTHNQCDMLLSFFLENINGMYHAVHVPSFRKTYNEYWSTETDLIDLSWLSLLFIIIAESALCVSAEVTLAMGLSPQTIRELGHKWYYASRQSLHAAGFESRPRLIHLQTFLVSQMYWLATMNVETLNS